MLFSINREVISLRFRHYIKFSIIIEINFIMRPMPSPKYRFHIDFVSINIYNEKCPVASVRW